MPLSTTRLMCHIAGLEPRKAKIARQHAGPSIHGKHQVSRASTHPARNILCNMPDLVHVSMHLSLIKVAACNKAGGLAGEWLS